MLKNVLVSAATLMMFTCTAQASDSADLKISALLETGACTPSLSDGGEAHFGNIPLSNLNATSTNQLGSRFLTLTINCLETTSVGWSITDNKKDSVQQLEIKNPKFNGENLSDVNYQYGLGKTAGNVKIGAYAIYTDLNNVTADGVKAKVMYISTNGSKFGSGAGEIINNSGYINTVEVWGATAGTPLSAKNFIWPLKITAAIQDTNTLNISDDTPLDGSSTISIVYL
ncbi:DUF1120 domain-containing protein [Cronobacter dublinensis]|uniref:DUF1120 domain-containing protein n=1 Tax=Cronobacter dublinensis TaxID=413497 RepID=UPI000CFD79CC|nr:DUF1120 domain-containing protein [Cronobacter dublinensis]EKY3091022.1 DUF1120 domain-containing protein [Cronobacter dublinensis]ELQ6230397.1 DUF1120 domain-containing protein [Cronobacter dublinensis]ELY4006308.1 DUF1120 domain-containing protein [Cronobacter dublinensis]ELY4408374.1 DUF1120 domain-containing protein [Cronobacter dublinensis]ELY5821428.1 DUF1120 domain-containing protein [Cronobacter dublinensis]